MSVETKPMSRSQAREQAFKVLFQLPFQKVTSACEDPAQNAEAIEELYLKEFSDEFEEENLVPDDKGLAFIRSEVSGVVSHLKEIDELIKPALKGWSLERLAPADLAVLRLATYELICPDENGGVEITMNEAVELSKKYSHDDGYAFVNGALRTIWTNLQKV